jgi:hypothetical protein
MTSHQRIERRVLAWGIVILVFGWGVWRFLHGEHIDVGLTLVAVIFASLILRKNSN